MFTPSLFAEDLDHVLAHTRDDWEAMRGQRLFMTGGTGFFGMWLIETFLWANLKLELGAEVHVLSRDPAAFLRKMPHLAGQPGLAFHAGSMDSFEFPGGEFSHVIHAATENYDSPAAPDLLAAFDRDIQGTRRVLDFARQCGAKRMLFTSSGAVYGLQPSELTHIPEDYAGSFAPTDTRSGYGQAKRVSEFLCALYGQAEGFEAKIARCFAFLGPYLPLDRNFAAGNFLRDALAGDPIVIRGDGTPYRSYLYTADLAVWLWTILFRGRSCRPYNVGSDEDLTIAALAQLVLDVVAPATELRVLQAADPSKPSLRYVPDTKRAHDDLGLRVNIGLREGIGRTAAWCRRKSLPQ
ncbi:MAG: NAD-dependent epimerase/dehydratase family protein [Thermoguttaceae bacterium]